MSLIEQFSKFEKNLRPMMSHLPPEKAVRILTKGRKEFLERLIDDTPPVRMKHSPNVSKKIWGIEFSCPLFNAAGVFKNGFGYELCAAQGAGAFLAGTTTFLPRQGNIKNGIEHPFASYPRSGAAANWMGLPNQGHEEVAAKISKIEKKLGCPVGISISSSPEQGGEDALEGVLRGLQMFDKAGVDFVEINESCPNVSHKETLSESSIPEPEKIISTSLDTRLLNRLEYLYEKFLNKRTRNLPVVLKLSNDTDKRSLTALLDIMFALGFDGVNIGNTSTDYEYCLSKIVPAEQKLFKYFADTFGGGVSGAPLKQKSLDLAGFAAEYTANFPPNQEFHVIRTGGINLTADITASEKAGISLNQWFTGYFENFAESGHALYKIFFENL